MTWFIGGLLPNRAGITGEMAYMHDQEDKKKIIEVGGVGNKWGNKYHQQDRVYDRRGLIATINTGNNNGNVIRKWKR